MHLKICSFSLFSLMALSASFIACGDSESVAPSPVAYESSSSIAVTQSSSSEDIPTSSSEIPISSSSSASFAVQTGFQTWRGTDRTQRINTGYDAGTETSGHWFTYGGACFVWPAEPDYNPNDLYWMDVIIDQCEALCGIAHFYKGEMTEGVTFAGLGFIMAANAIRKLKYKGEYI